MAIILSTFPPSLAAESSTSEAGNYAGTGSSILSRLHILEMEQIVRFNYMDLQPRQVIGRDIQYRVRSRLQVNLAGEGTTYLRLRAETGRGFDNSWDNTGLGLHPGRWNFNVKSFALGHKLSSGVELQAGGIEWDLGAGSQRAFASGDGHLVGYRVLVTPTAQPWLPEKIAVTMGYAGDFNEPSVFSRFHLGKLNYFQALAQKQLANHVQGSLEVDVIRNIWFERQAIHWEQLKNPLFDEVMVEAVLRASDRFAAGGSILVSRPLDAAARWRAFAIYNQIPTRLYQKNGLPILFNQGEMDLGKRVAWGGSYAVTKDFSVGMFGGRLVDQTPSKRWIAQVYLRYNYANLLNGLLR